jgi:hypothetical protein
MQVSLKFRSQQPQHLCDEAVFAGFQSDSTARDFGLLN